MAEGFVSFGVQKLWDLLSRESERLQGIDDQVDGLKRQLRRLQSLLKDADAKKHGSERVRNFLEDVKDIVYDADDIIESFLLKKLRGKEKGIKKHVRRLACFLIDRHKVASDIEGITKRISEVIGGMQSLGIHQIIDGTHSLSLLDRQREQREIRHTFANSSESDLVGVEQSVKELVGHLVENDNIQLVSISGMGGIGKTTLARQVFHHDIVRRHFDGFAWVCVSQQFTQKHVWQRIWQELRPHDAEILQMDEYAVQGKLYKLLETARYLVVLDDVWKEEDWDRIKAVFPRKRGWKMLLTSRNEGVGLHADPTCLPFRPRILNPEESWKLCERIVFLRRDETELRLNEEMEAMGKEMVTYCGGLPLAVKVLGGLLSNKHTDREWKRVYDNTGAQIVGKSCLDDNSLNSVYRVLSLSYEDLPTRLKHCFLYLAHFPEDYKIHTRTLFNYWAAEGIYDGSTIRDSGEDYLEELVRRNLVIADKNYLRSRFEYFQMHDMMREFEGGKLPSRIGGLIHLRFLSLFKAGVSHLPSSMGNLKLLLYLNLNVANHEPVHVPNVLKEMLELRKRVDAMSSLLTIHNCKKLKELPDGLKYMTSLKELKIEGMKRKWKEKITTESNTFPMFNLSTVTTNKENNE
ncbi:P-loop containing nucleoside triphosphate hydrolase [Arabidopsis thaliana x Arabidopsis arenosa]|uniref:P-loop containing nucleoside triphosphate hydrolase n=1 Tax=Arabidopsis thaliana x Arabidopsis arenosa TaxID=1240361 RepID=A0A8T1XFV4_9BRAS|nr:P-loop containing nucleoside triphosphate hydrolase [Arabidopsis thaliana x Arabidopsis arenosa]